MQETWVWSPGREHPLEKGMATHSSILAWRISWRDHGVTKSWTQLSDSLSHFLFPPVCKYQEFKICLTNSPEVCIKIQELKPSRAPRTSEMIHAMSRSSRVEVTAIKSLKIEHFFKEIFLFIDFIFGCTGSLLLHRLFCGCEQGLLVRGQSLSGFSCCWAQALGYTGFRMWHVGSIVAAPELQSTGLIFGVHRLSCSAACGIFWTGDRAHVSCTDRQILSHWATREALKIRHFLEILISKRGW